MKYLSALMLICFCSGVQANCVDTWLVHISGTPYLSIGYELGCFNGPLTIYTKESQTSSIISSQVAFEKECPSRELDKNGEISKFSCSKTGSTILAGATFRAKHIQPKYRCSNGTRPQVMYFFQCIRGCKSGTPKVLHFAEGGSDECVQ